MAELGTTTCEESGEIMAPSVVDTKVVDAKVMDTKVVDTKVVATKVVVTKARILRNVFILATAFMFLFTSYQAVANLQSSLNKTSGTASLSALYAALIVSCIFIPSWMIRRFSHKWTLSICMLGYATYIAAQFHARIYTLIPTAIVLGLCAAPMWAAKCAYLTQLGKKYAELVGEKSDVIISRFFGFFFLFFQSAQVWGNLISSTVLSLGQEPNPSSNVSESMEHCGANFCPASFIDEFETNASLSVMKTNWTGATIPQMNIDIMHSVYLTTALLASLLVAVFLDHFHEYEDQVEKDAEELTGVQLLISALNQLRHPYQLLLIPLTMWSGVQQAFIGADYTVAFVSCGLGAHMVGYVMITYGVCDALSSASFGHLVKLVGRPPIFTFAFALAIGISVVLWLWIPQTDSLFVYFILAGLWGVQDAVWLTQINALYGSVFSKGSTVAAFSNYLLWQSVGFNIGYACSTSLCIQMKLILLVGLLCTGMVGYYAIELLERKKWLKRDQDGNVLPIDQMFRSVPK